MTAETGRTELVTSEAEDLRELVARTRYVLFDFDGPICRLFAGHPADVIARDQVEWMETRGLGGMLTEEERFSKDPHGTLSSLHARYPGSDVIAGLEENLTRHELRAARVAMPTAYADPLIQTWVAVGARLAVVTNNSARTVTSYLNDRGLFSCFDPHIYGRTQELRLLKPHPEMLNRALTAMGAAPEASLMIGDALSDHAAARAAGVRFLGYARNPGAHRRMREGGVPAQSIMSSLKPLLQALWPGRF
ncbi:HAD-IA family hydrolase [Streptomyces sp. NPDC002088]|uniref:HAD family hydrolase n=1 Tax=unclassified Streptomyces TaxID=2593676 RepID=UPI0033283E52